MNLITLGIVIICGISLILWELKVELPFIDIRILSKNLALTRIYIRLALLTLCIYTVLYGFTEWLEAGHGFSSSEAGLLLLPMSILSASDFACFKTKSYTRSVNCVCSIFNYSFRTSSYFGI